MATRGDFRQRLNNRLIESIEENAGVPWDQGGISRPFNPVSGVKYKGGNVLNLQIEQIERGSDDPRWMTLKQANSAGYSIRPGSKAAYVEYWDWSISSDNKEASANQPVDETVNEEDEAPRKPRAFYAAVFNGNDVVGLPELEQSSSVGSDAVENLIKAASEFEGVSFSHRKSSQSDDDYNAIVLRQLAKSVGQLNGLSTGPIEADQKDLRSELASMILASSLGIHSNVESTGKRSEVILEVLKSDRHEVFRAARDAEKIVENIFELVPELRELSDAYMRDNLLSQMTAERKLDTGISPDLPSFIPPEAKKLPEHNSFGKHDSRWASFDSTVKEQALKAGVDQSVVERSLSLIEPQFTQVMNAAEANGYSAEEMNMMLSRSIIDEMQTADLRQQQWESYSEKVRNVGAGSSYSSEQIELALQEQGIRYQQLISKSVQENWSKSETDTEIRSLVFGEEGRRPVTEEFLRELIENSPAAQQVKPSSESDDDFVLTPLGLSGEMPEDAGVAADEHIL